MTELIQVKLIPMEEADRNQFMCFRLIFSFLESQGEYNPHTFFD